MVIYEIQLEPQRSTAAQVTLNGVTYNLHLTYADVIDGGWYLDIHDAADAPLVAGIALVTGADLVEPYRYLGFAFLMWVKTDGIPAMVPDWDTLGRNSHLMVAY